MFNVNFKELNRISERIPNLFIDQCKIFCKNNNVYAYGEFGKIQLPLQKILSLTIGAHATISSASLILMHKSNTHVSFAKRNGIFYYMPAIGATDKNKNSEKHAIAFSTKFKGLLFSR